MTGAMQHGGWGSGAFLLSPVTPDSFRGDGMGRETGCPKPFIIGTHAACPAKTA